MFDTILSIQYIHLSLSLKFRSLSGFSLPHDNIPLTAPENFCSHGSTGEKFDKAAEEGDIAARIEKNVSEWLATRK